MARGHRLNTSIVLAAVHGLSGLFRAVSAVEPSLSRPLSPLSPSLISNLASVDVKQYGQGHHQNDSCIERGSNESHFNTSLTVMWESHKTVSMQRPQQTPPRDIPVSNLVQVVPLCVCVCMV